MSMPVRYLPLPLQTWAPLDIVQYRSDAGNFPLNRNIYGLLIEVSYRNAVGVAAADAENVESPQAILDRIHIYGQHRHRNEQTEIVDLRGATAYTKFGTIYRSRTPQSTGLAGVGIGDKDVRFFIPVIFPPQKVSILQQAGYLLDAPNYEWIQMDLHMGDGTSMYDPAGTTTFAFTQFGGASGSPQIRILRMIPNLRGERVGFISGLVRHYFRELIGSDLTTTATGVRLYDVRPGNRYRAFLLKAGVKMTEATATLNPFATLSDAILSQLHFKRNDVTHRHFQTFNIGRELLSEQYDSPVPVGYAAFEFADYGDIRQWFDTSRFKKDNVEAWIEADVAGAANQALEVIVEEIVGGPAFRS